MMIYPRNYSASIIFAIASIPFLSLSPAQSQNTRDDIQVSLQLKYNEADEGRFKRQGAKATAHFTKDYTFTDRQGNRINLAQIQQQYKWSTELANDFLISSKTAIKSIEIKNSTAEVITKQYDRRVYSIHYQTVRDTWINTPQGWFLQASKVFPSPEPAYGSILNAKNDILRLVQSAYEAQDIDFVKDQNSCLSSMGSNLYWRSRTTMINNAVLKGDKLEVLVERYHLTQISKVFTSIDTATDTWINTAQGWQLQTPPKSCDLRYKFKS
jgi:hypothetical protein